MAEREYYCAGCETPHIAPLWYVRQVNNNYGPIKADYLCRAAHSQLSQTEQAVWGSLV